MPTFSDSPEQFAVRRIELGGIGIKADRLRALRPTTVEELMASIKINGLLQPIVLRPAESSGYWLVAGRHRLEAAKKLKWDSIPAMVFDGMDADHAELAEIDENLVRADLTPIERALHVARRKVLYEAEHPETRRGAAGKHRQKSQIATSDEPASAFIDDTAVKTGKHRATVARDVARGKLDGIEGAIGTSLDKGDEVDALIKLPADARDALIKRAKAGEKVSARTVAKKVTREQRERDLGAKIVALPQKKYGVILADPEWRFEPWSRETGMDRAADNHYPTSATEVIAARDVASIAADDCVLFLWATSPLLPQALEVMKAWGFAYVSVAVWVKDRIGTGYWFRNRHELLLVGTRGNVPAPAMGAQWDSVIEAAAGEHSAKPDAALEMIDAYFPSLPKIELNRRGVPRPGWEAWGNEAAKESEFRYVRHADVPRFAAEGWEPLPALDGTHHGEYSVLMRRRI